jgi:hypothetical protein
MLIHLISQDDSMKICYIREFKRKQWQRNPKKDLDNDKKQKQKH